MLIWPQLIVYKVARTVARCISAYAKVSWRTLYHLGVQLAEAFGPRP